MHRIDTPMPGYYATRLCKGGPLVPAKITQDNWDLSCTINGRDTDPYEAWPWLAGTPISKEVFIEMEHRRIWAERNAPWHYAANPLRPIKTDDILETLK